MSIEYIDLGRILEAASAQLPDHVNTLVHGEAFSLLEAMSAMEIGNVKMDTGLQKTAEVEPIETLMQRLPSSLSSEQRVAVADRLFEQEAHWLAGGSLAATVFTCLYMLKTDEIREKDATLWAYCEGLKASCSLIRSLIYKGGVAEEEDFNLHAFGLPIDEGAGGEIGSMARAKEALEALGLALRQCQDLSSSSSSEADKKAWASMGQRIKWRTEMLRGLHTLCDSTRPDVASTASHFSLALDLLTASDGGIQFDKPSPSPSESIVGFEPSINSRLLAPIPPRVVKPMDWSECCSLIQSILAHINQALNCLDSVSTFDTLQMRLRAFTLLKAGPLARSVAHYVLIPQTWGHTDHAASATTLDPEAPWPPSIPLLQDAPDHHHPLGDVPSFVPSKEMIASTCGLPRNAHRLLCSDVDVFLEQCSIAVGNWCQAMLMNPSRMRRRLRRGLEDWGHLYQHALAADHSPGLLDFMQKRGWKWPPQGGQDVSPRPLSSWVEKETCSCMLQHLLMGFELDLYQNSELVMIYWYCDSIVSSQRGATLLFKEAIPSPEPSGKSATPKLPTRGASGKKGSKQSGGSKASSSIDALAKEDVAAWEARRSVADAEMIRLERMHWMLQGYMRLILAANKIGLVKDTPLPFNDAAQRFEQRFSSFHTLLVCPEPLPYPDFVSSTDVSSIDAVTLLKLASESFTNASKVLSLVEIKAPSSADQVASLKTLFRIVTQNKLCCEVLARAVEESATLSLQLTFDFSTSPAWPAIGASRIKDR